MKKFLFTLAALLAVTTAFAQSDAKYLYVNSELTVEDPETENGLILTLSAEFPGRLSAMHCIFFCPQGLRITYVEAGADYPITFYNARGRSTTESPAIAFQETGTDPDDNGLGAFVIANMTAGYYQVDGSWVSYGAIKWEAGYYEEFVLAYAEYDETYHGGNVVVETIPSSGGDPRGGTIDELGDKSRPFMTDATEPLEDPQPVVTAPNPPVITFAGEETAQMTVTVTAEEGCTLIVNGEAVEGNPYTYTVDRADIYTAGTVNVTAKAVKDGQESTEATGSKAFVVADRPTAAEPVINFVETKNENDEVTKVEVVITDATSYVIRVDGELTDAQVFEANYTAEQVITVEAVNDPGYPYVANDNSDSYTLNKLDKITPAAPVITYTMDADKVYVTVTWNESDGDKIFDGEYEYDRPEYGQPDESYTVVAYTLATDKYNESPRATEDIPVPAKDPVWQSVDAPEINYTMDDNNVYVTIEWPTSTGNQVYTGQETYARPEYGQPDESYPVEAYTEADYPYAESTHATATIEVPAKDPVWQEVAAPVITTDVQEDKVVVTIEWPTSTGNQVYTGEYEYARPEYGQPDESYNVEAYVEADYPYAESTHATETIEVPAKGAQWVDGTAPVIEFIPTMDGNIVTEVEVVVTGADTYTIKVNGEALRGEKIAASYDEVKNIHVEAVKNANYPYMEATAEGNYTLNKLVAAPVISTEVYEDKVFVNITWPTTDGNNVYTGEYTYDRGEADQSFNVEAYTAAAGEYQESFHATATIEVPALEQTPDQTADPVITTTTGKYNEGYINITCADENAIIYYRYQLDDGEWTEWTEYEGPVMLVENGHYNIEAKAQDPEKEMSNVVEGELTVSDCTAVYEVTTGKAIANVRYFNLAGQEMQEANGMTIIVTTYTDGTTSAVKVMK